MAVVMPHQPPLAAPAPPEAAALPDKLLYRHGPLELPFFLSIFLGALLLTLLGHKLGRAVVGLVAGLVPVFLFTMDVFWDGNGLAHWERGPVSDAGFKSVSDHATAKSVSSTGSARTHVTVPLHRPMHRPCHHVLSDLHSHVGCTEVLYQVATVSFPDMPTVEVLTE